MNFLTCSFSLIAFNFFAFFLIPSSTKLLAKSDAYYKEIGTYCTALGTVAIVDCKVSEIVLWQFDDTACVLALISLLESITFFKSSKYSFRSNY